MATTMRLQDMTPSLTPPPSDRGGCDDTSMLNAEAYLPEVFYPSPAPSFTHQRSAFSPRSPDMSHREPTYDTPEDNQPLLFGVDSSSAQMYPSTTATTHPVDMYSHDMSYQSFEQPTWMPFGTYATQNALYPYAHEDPMAVFGSYPNPAPTQIIPPTPQHVTGGSFNFNEPLRPQEQSSGYLSSSYPSHPLRNHSPIARSATSTSGVSSRSCSPSLSVQAATDAQGNRNIRNSSSQIQRSSGSLHAYGIPIRTPGSSNVQAWRCAYPNCTSRAVFTRGCDLRKHYNRHSKHLFCRVEGCPQSEAACIAAAQQQATQAGGEPSDPSRLVVSGGFSSKKDRARHEAKHNPGIKCEWRGPNGEECGRLFSRMDNMKDHVRRIHNKGQNQGQSQQTQSKARSR